MMLRIFVTGANGFVGRELCKYLGKSGHEVRRAVRGHDGSLDTFEINEKSSVSDMQSALSGVDCVIHLAARVHVLGKTSAGLEAVYRETNVEFTKRLAIAAHDAGVSRFVFVSSIKVCGEISHNGPFVEDGDLQPLDSYAISKWEAEKSLQQISAQTGLDVVIVRPPLVYGEGVKANFLSLLSVVRTRIPLPFSRLTNKRSLIYLGNFVSSLAICAIHPKAAGNVFHVSDSESVTLPKLIDEISRSMGKRSRMFPFPTWVVKFAGTLVGKYQQVDRLVNDLEVDTSKIQHLLGWSPPYKFETGIKNTVEWYLSDIKDRSHFVKAHASDSLKVCQLCAVDFTLKHLLLPLVDGMREHGWSVTSVCSDGKYVPEMRQRGYRIFTVSISRNLFSVFTHLHTVFVLYRFFKHEKFDALHVHTPIAALLGRIAGRLANIPLIVYTAHGFYFHDEMPKWKYRLYAALERLSGSLTNVIFTQSSEDAQVAVSERISRPDNVFAIGNGVDVDLFDPARSEQRMPVRAQFSIPANAYVVGVVSRLVKEKGLVEFLEAAVALSKKFPEAYFLLVGERLPSDHDASIEKELKDAAAKLGSRLVAVGYQSNVADFLAAMDVFCLPSYREGMPRSIIEAMMMELPVVATNIRGSREEVVAGETGILVQTHSAAALIDALSSMISDRDLTTRMGRAGRIRALKLYDERGVVAHQIGTIESYVTNLA